MDDDQRQIISQEEETTVKDIPEGKIEIKSTHSIIANEDGSKSYVTNVIEKKTGEGMIGDPHKIEEYSLGVSLGDTKYVDIIKSKEELAIMYDDKLKCFLKVSSFEKILSLMNESLANYFDSLSFAIYSSEEIIELRNNTHQKQNY